MSGNFEASVLHALEALEHGHLRRQLEPLDSPQGPSVSVGGQRLINFSSNDYLGLASDADVVAAARATLLEAGFGAGASRLVVGDSQCHHQLERDLADFEGSESALLFNSGYAANVGVLGALFQAGDVIFSDALNHASLIDGCRLSRAQVVVYRHGDVAHVDSLLHAHSGRRRVVVTDTVFSMDGDVAPIGELREVCDRHGAALMVDEAHATGVVGARGAGLCEAQGVKAELHIGTLSKALGGFGAYACVSRNVRELLINVARPLVFSTALPPSVCAGARTALHKLRFSGLRAALWERIEQLASGLRGLGLLRTAPSSAIFSLVVGEPQVALYVAQALREDGLLVKAIRPPTVPEGTSRLRIAVSAGHTAEDIERLLSAVAAQRHVLKEKC